ncbi:hypothetical protein SAMN05421866_3481 [Chryseobacterium oranimense]|uniref:Uncharacterized protein n=1 Tax=Chryseobacterium oranimense TaxID=421058 RepID=A0A1M5V0N3_9FLAO|nr:hypothetical protein [Chryseobacterium oranimense]SHH68720.1 hypothetical protein SAMN05421866_3481 [Chryseobacterium oranimense]
MANKRLTFNRSSISLTYNRFTSSTTGDNTFVGYLIDGLDPVTSQIDYYCDPIIIIGPNPSDSSDTVFVYVDAVSLPVGNYEYVITAKAFDDTVSKDIKLYLKVIDENTIPEEDRPYNLKYWFENEVSPEVKYRCEIKERGYEGQSTEINGTAEHKYQEKTDHFQPLVASSIELKLLADSGLTLQDLYSEDEKNYKVFLFRNEQLIFVGFLKPDGIWEDYVYDRWELSIDAYDGLSTLKDMSFSNENGMSFIGKQNGLSIIKNCLKKTGLDLPINVNCEIEYDGFIGDIAESTIFEGAFFNMERYFQDAKEPMDCESVLKSIIQIFNCTVMQMHGEWFIYRSIDTKENMFFTRYVNGAFSDYNVWHPEITIGSQINNFDVFHCNSNQRKSISPSVQAYRISYEYGGANAIFRNPELKLEGAGLDIPGWVVDNLDGRVVRNEDGFGVDSQTNWFNDEIPTLLRLAQDIDISQGAIFKLMIRYSNVNQNSVGIRYSVAVGNQWLNEDGSWSTAGGSIFVNNSIGTYNPPYHEYMGKGEAVVEASIKAPISGKLNIIIYRDVHRLGGGRFKVHSISLTGTSEGDVKGRVYTAQRKKKLSTVTKSDITVYNGDSVSDLFVGTIYKDNGETPTDKWHRKGMVETKEILEINAEDNIRIAPRPMIIFEGDIYGYIPYLSLISYDNISGNFLPMNYTLNTSDNTIRLVSREFSSTNLDSSDFYVDIKDNYGNETKVTIV